MYKCC